MKKILLLLIIPFLSFGQGWEQIFGGADNDSGRSVCQTSDGGYIVCGATSSFGNGGSDVYLVKTDENGDEQWSQFFGGTDDDGSYSVQQTTDGGYVLTGYTYFMSTVDNEVFLIKTDSNGEEEWSQTYGGNYEDIAYSVTQTIDGGYIIAGWTFFLGSGSSDIYLLKTDQNGIEQWEQTFGGIDFDYGYSVQQTIDGGYIITGMTSSFENGYGDVYLLKTDQNGAEQWTQTFGGTNAESGHSVQQTIDEGYIITGITSSFGNGYSDVYLIKTDENGIEQWEQTFGGTEGDYGHSVKQTIDGGYIIVGNSFEGGNSDVYLIKTDENGIEQWEQTFGGTEIDVGYSVEQTNDGGYIIAGSSFENGSSSVYLIKTDGEGYIIHTSAIELNTPISKRKLTKTIDILGRETTNKGFQLHIYDDGSVEKKYLIK